MNSLMKFMGKGRGLSLKDNQDFDFTEEEKNQKTKKLAKICRKLKLKKHTSFSLKSVNHFQELMIIYDATLSMSSVWEETLAGLEKLANRLTQLIPGIKISFVAFRESVDWIKKLSATKSIETMKNFIASIDCNGGHSFSAGCEAVEVGLQEFLRSKAEAAILVGDASPHSGYEDILKKLTKEEKNVYTVVVNSKNWFYENTKETYRKIAEETGGKIYELENLDDLIDVLSAMVAHKIGSVSKLFEIVKKENRGFLTEKQKKILLLE